jgi:hypothetical protein
MGQLDIRRLSLPYLRELNQQTRDAPPLACATYPGGGVKDLG